MEETLQSTQAPVVVRQALSDVVITQTMFCLALGLLLAVLNLTHPVLAGALLADARRLAAWTFDWRQLLALLPDA